MRLRTANKRHKRAMERKVYAAGLANWAHWGVQLQRRASPMVNMTVTIERVLNQTEDQMRRAFEASLTSAIRDMQEPMIYDDATRERLIAIAIDRWGGFFIPATVTLNII